MTTRPQRRPRRVIEPLLIIAKERHSPDTVTVARFLFEALQGAVNFIPIAHEKRHAFLRELEQWLYEQLQRHKDIPCTDLSQIVFPASARYTEHAPDLQLNKSHSPVRRSVRRRRKKLNRSVFRR